MKPQWNWYCYFLFAEHVCSIIASCLRNLKAQQRTRLLSKFTENDCEKVRSSQIHHCADIKKKNLQYFIKVHKEKCAPLFGFCMLSSRIEAPWYRCELVLISLWLVTVIDWNIDTVVGRVINLTTSDRDNSLPEWFYRHGRRHTTCLPLTVWILFSPYLGILYA